MSQSEWGDISQIPDLFITAGGFRTAKNGAETLRWYWENELCDKWKQAPDRGEGLNKSHDKESMNNARNQCLYVFQEIFYSH